MGLTGSNSGLYTALHFIVSPVGKGERRKKRRREMGKKGIEKKWMERRKEEGMKKIRGKIRRNFNKN